ncbi:hypothetical protein GCM10025859_39340 [Alicyclobacillus fastidiosus]|nr:hypothetical protein GCM10025859_39340 [Alicyclobacillus fastidiosus]
MNRLLTKEKSIIQTTQLDKFIEYMEYPTMIFDQHGELLHCNQTAKDQSCNQIGSKSISLIRDTPDDDFYSSCLLNGTQHDLAINKLHFDDITLFMISIGPTYAKGNEAQTVDELQKIIDSVHDGIYISDNRGFTLQINKRYSEMTGINGHEVIGRHISELIYRGYFDSSITVKVLEKRQTVSILQRTKDSNQMWLVTGNPIFNQNGCLLKVLNTVYDMTELNQVKESLRAQEIANNTQRAELEVLRSQVVNVPDLIGNSRLTNNIKIQIKKVSNFDSTVLILGETGSGKNVVARAIHKLSPRSSNPFIEVNCGSLPEQLIESELFGYSSGAFTGAVRGGKPGLLEVAHNGTIFLDEIGEMPYQLQVKLLTFLQDRKIRRVGETTSREVNVRVIAATNKDLKQLVTEKKFREDLYYRLSVVPIQIPRSVNEKKIYML